MAEHRYDSEADAIYITLRSSKYMYGKDLDDERRIDYSSSHQPIGIELLSVSRGVNLYGLPSKEEVTNILGIYGIKAYSLTPYAYGRSETGIPNVAFSVQFIGTEDEELDKTEAGVKEEVTA
ncbi:MAG TPA: DUF2283 domain-containing protein [Dehalococcoidales bacterium]|nr:DUF2283 domain-containing protein [Dehalococcoidales bacterium]